MYGWPTNLPEPCQWVTHPFRGRELISDQFLKSDRCLGVTFAQLTRILSIWSGARAV